MDLSFGNRNRNLSPVKMEFTQTKCLLKEFQRVEVMGGGWEKSLKFLLLNFFFLNWAENIYRQKSFFYLKNFFLMADIKEWYEEKCVQQRKKCLRRSLGMGVGKGNGGGGEKVVFNESRKGFFPSE